MTSSSQPFFIESRHNEPICGDWHPCKGPANATIIFVHGFKGFKDWGFYPTFAEFLSSHGYNAVRFNFSRNGIGTHPMEIDRLDLFERNTFGLELDDLTRVVNHINTFSTAPLVLIGHSRGGGIAILYASNHPEIRGLITLASISTFERWSDGVISLYRQRGYIETTNSRTGQVLRMGLDLLNDYEANREAYNISTHARNITIPTYIIHGLSDESVSHNEAEDLLTLIPGSIYWPVPQGNHTFGAIHPWDGAEGRLIHDVMEETRQFLDRNFAQSQ